MSALAVNIRSCANGWLVEVWRGRNPKEEHVFVDTNAALQFVAQLLRHG